MNKIRVHRCFDPENEKPPLNLRTCGCREWVTVERRDGLLDAGCAVKAGGDNIVMKRRVYRKAQTARTISAFDIDRAFVEGQKSSIDRIEAFRPTNLKAA